MNTCHESLQVKNKELPIFFLKKEKGQAFEV